MNLPLVYDVGMNVGMNLPYYWAKGCRVVGIEADPRVAALAREKFAQQIVAGLLEIENCGVALEAGTFSFYVNKKASQLSSLRRPDVMDENWNELPVPCQRLSEIISRHGDPYFIKIDVEHYDEMVIHDLDQNSIRPTYLSAEAHSFRILCRLVNMGYSKFKVVNCKSIGSQNRPSTLSTIDGQRFEYKFPVHSAGPFGEDIDSDWLSAEGAALVWLGRANIYGPGWFDIHCKR